MNNTILGYAVRQLETTAQEDGFTVTKSGSKLHIVVKSGKTYQLADEEIIYLAKEFLESEIEYVKTFL